MVFVGSGKSEYCLIVKNSYTYALWFGSNNTLHDDLNTDFVEKVLRFHSEHNIQKLKDLPGAIAQRLETTDSGSLKKKIL